jgi:hypothetical protein
MRTAALALTLILAACSSPMDPTVQPITALATYDAPGIHVVELVQGVPAQILIERTPPFRGAPFHLWTMRLSWVCYNAVDFTAVNGAVRITEFHTVGHLTNTRKAADFVLEPGQTFRLPVVATAGPIEYSVWVGATFHPVGRPESSRQIMGRGFACGGHP